MTYSSYVVWTDFGPGADEFRFKRRKHDALRWARDEVKDGARRATVATVEVEFNKQIMIDMLNHDVDLGEILLRGTVISTYGATDAESEYPNRLLAMLTQGSLRET